LAPRLCIECKKPAKFRVKTYDDQTLYLCEEHVKDWYVPKISKLTK